MCFQKNLEASEFLQNVVYINVHTEEGKVRDSLSAVGAAHSQVGITHNSSEFHTVTKYEIRN